MQNIKMGQCGVVAKGMVDCQHFEYDYTCKNITRALKESCE